MGQILAIDYGKVRTGIAVTDDMQIIASGLTTVETPKLVDFLNKYFSENRKVKMLKFYLEIRSLYMNFRKNGFKKSNFLCAWW